MLGEAQDLAQRATITEMVRTFLAAAEDIRKSFAVIAAAEERLNSAFVLGSYNTFRVSARGYEDYAKPEDVIKHLERKAWDCLIERLELRRMMSVKAWNKLRHDLECGQLPPITEENVQGVLAGFKSQLPDMLNDAVQEVFEWLRPRNNEYKTNTEFEVGRKVILSCPVEPKTFGGGFEVRYHHHQNLTALENVFSALDGKGQISKSYHSLLSNAIKDSGKSGRGETEYFRFKCFKNGNLHLEFRRLDLLDRLNAIAGGNRLRSESRERSAS